MIQFIVFKYFSENPSQVENNSNDVEKLFTCYFFYYMREYHLDMLR